MAFNSVSDLWVVCSAPAAAAQATASRAAAAAGIKHVAHRAFGSISTIAATAQTPLNVNLRDGATGAGTIVGCWSLAALGTTFAAFDTGGLSSLGIVGTAATAMTLETTGATVANALGTTTLIGYDIP
jgi:hypothetical protein